MRRVLAYLALSLGAVAVAACTLPRAYAADKSRTGKIAAPKQYEPPRYTAPEDEAPAYKAHNWYVGGAGGYAWTPDGVADSWHGGIYAGYLWRPNAVLAMGIEADYMLRDLGDIALDDGVASLRGRLGLFISPTTFVYGTAGVAQATPAFVPDGFRKGAVVGGGVEVDVLKGLAIRAEVLHYRHGDGYFEWADDSSTAARLGMAIKF
jgi:opacity protein-like surface antigen